jgi:hypothetical protein
MILIRRGSQGLPDPTYVPERLRSFPAPLSTGEEPENNSESDVGHVRRDARGGAREGRAASQFRAAD